MRSFVYIGIAVILGFLSCNYKPVNEETANSLAMNFIKQADSTTIQLFKTWEYGKRGEVEIWSKLNRDSTIYTILSINSGDTMKITTSNLNEFRKDFAISITLDTTKFWKFSFYEYKNKVRILATDTLGKDFFLAETYKLSYLFPNKNPFQHIKKLTELKNSLGIIGSSYMPRIGDFIQFYLSPEYILTYLPDTTAFDKRYKSIWLNEFSKGKRINKIWNLRKTEQLKDNG